MDNGTDQIKTLEGQLSRIEKENGAMNFMKKQSDAQVKKLERQCVSLDKQLKQLQQCGACKCIDKRRKKSNFTSEVRFVDPLERIPDELSQVKVHPDLPDLLKLHDAKSTAMQTELERLKRALEMSEADRAKKDAEIERLRGLFAGSSVARLAQRDKEVVELRTEIAQLNHKNQVLSDKLVEVEGQLQSSQRNASNSENVNADTQKDMEYRLRTLIEEAQQLKFENQRLKLQTENFGIQLRQREAQLKQSELRGNDLAIENRDLKFTIHRLEAKEKDLASEIEYLRWSRTLNAGDLPARSTLNRSRSENVLEQQAQSRDRFDDPQIASTSDFPRSGLAGVYYPSATTATTTAKKTTFGTGSTKSHMTAATTKDRGYNRYCPVCRAVHQNMQACKNKRLAGVVTSNSRARSGTCSGAMPNVFSSTVPEHNHQPLRATAATANLRNYGDDVTTASYFDPDKYGFEKGSDAESSVIKLLKTQLKELNEQCRTLQNKVRLLENEVERARQEKKLMEADRDAQRKLYTKAKDDVTNLRQEILETRTGLNPAGAYFTASQGPIGTSTPQHYNNELVQLQLENDRLQQTLRETNAKYGVETAHTRTLVDSHEAQRRQLSEEVTQLSDTCHALRQERQQWSERCRSLEMDVTNLRMTIAQQSDSTSNLELTAKSSDTRLRDSRLAVDELRSKLVEAENSKLIAESKTGELSRNLQFCRSQLDQLQGQLTDLRTEKQVLEDQAKNSNLGQSDLLDQLKIKEREVIKLRSAIDALEVDYAKFQEGLSQQEAQIVHLQRELQLANSLRDQAQHERQSLGTENAVLSERLQTLQSQLEKTSTDYECAVQERDYIHRSLQQYVVELDTFKKMLADKENEIFSLFNQYEESVKEVGVLKAKQSTSSIEGRNQDDEVSDRLLLSAKEDIEALKREKENVRKDYSDLQDQLTTVETNMNGLKQVIEDLQNQNGSLHQDLITARQVCIEIEGTRTSSQLESDRLNSALVRAEDHIGQLEVEIAVLKNKLSENARSIEQLQSELQSSKTRELNNEGAASDAKNEILVIREQLTEKELQIKFQGDDLNRVRDQLKRATDEVEILRVQIRQLN